MKRIFSGKLNKKLYKTEDCKKCYHMTIQCLLTSGRSHFVDRTIQCLLTSGRSHFLDMTIQCLPTSGRSHYVDRTIQCLLTSGRSHFLNFILTYQLTYISMCVMVIYRYSNQLYYIENQVSHVITKVQKLKDDAVQSLT